MYRAPNHFQSAADAVLKSTHRKRTAIGEDRKIILYLFLFNLDYSNE